MSAPGDMGAGGAWVNQEHLLLTQTLSAVRAALGAGRLAVRVESLKCRGARAELPQEHLVALEGWLSELNTHPAGKWAAPALPGGTTGPCGTDHSSRDRGEQPC